MPVNSKIPGIKIEELKSPIKNIPITNFLPQLFYFDEAISGKTECCTAHLAVYKTAAAQRLCMGTIPGWPRLGEGQARWLLSQAKLAGEAACQSGLRRVRGSLGLKHS